MSKFDGKFRELRAAFKHVGIRGTWEKEPNGVRMIRCRNGANIHFSKTTKRIWLDGKPYAKATLGQLVKMALSGG